MKIHLLKIAHKRFSALEAIIPSYFRLSKFCNGVMAFCRGVAHLNLTGALRAVAFSNEIETFETSIFENVGDLEIGADVEAEYCIAPYGKHPHSGGLQIVDKAAADKMKSSANGIWENFKRKFGFGNPIPIYRGHPDDPNKTLDVRDMTTYGTVKAVYGNERGIMARIAWNSLKDALPKKMQFSPRWEMQVLGNGEFRPQRLVSIGLTHNPNIPGTDFANESAELFQQEQKTKGKKMLKKILIALGLTDAEATAVETNAEGALTEEQILAKIKPAAVSTEKPVADIAANEVLETALKAERKARAQMLVSNCIASGKLSKAEEPAAIEVLCNAKDFDTTATLFTSRPAAWGSSSRTDALGERNVVENEAAVKAEAAEREWANKVGARADTIVANEKVTYSEAFRRAEAELASEAPKTETVKE